MYYISTEQRNYNSVYNQEHFQYVRKMNHDNSPVVNAWAFNRDTQTWIKTAVDEIEGNRPACPECGGTVFDQECWKCRDCGFRWMDNGA